jgi:hypothetical protein
MPPLRTNISRPDLKVLSWIAHTNQHSQRNKSAEQGRRKGLGRSVNNSPWKPPWLSTTLTDSCVRSVLVTTACLRLLLHLYHRLGDCRQRLIVSRRCGHNVSSKEFSAVLTRHYELAPSSSGSSSTVDDRNAQLEVLHNSTIPITRKTTEQLCIYI